MILRRWLREFTEFFFQKGNALNLAIAVVVGTQFQQIVDAISKDLLMPLLTPLVRGGDWQNPCDSLLRRKLGDREDS